MGCGIIPHPINFSHQGIKVNRIKRIVFGFSFFYLTLYIPLALMVYFPYWYILNFKFHHRYEMIGIESAVKYINELTCYFRHCGQLESPWSLKERIHLVDVRNILDVLLIIGITVLLLTIFLFKSNRPKLPPLALLNLVIILSFIIIIPFFRYFWVNIFHPLLFDNYLWWNNYHDRSYYIMPGIFFKISMIFLIMVSAGINGITWFFLRKLKGENSNNERSD